METAEAAIETIHASIPDWHKNSSIVKKFLHNRETTFYWASTDGKLIGYVCLHRTGCVPYIAVAKSKSRSGVGRALMLKAAKKARKLGNQKLELTSENRANDFYRKIENEIGPVKIEIAGQYSNITYSLLPH
jgi:N-acetylglutamate synthase-like GNAT family acetyltransferase